MISASVKDYQCNKVSIFETWLRSHGNLKSQAGDVIDKIVKPVISDGACRSLILQNKDFYMDLINTAGDDAYELKRVSETSYKKIQIRNWLNLSIR